MSQIKEGGHWVWNLPYSAPMLLEWVYLSRLRDPKEGLVYPAKWDHSEQPTY
jgi:hypothetical protein